METSAKDGTNVNKAFERLANDIRSQLNLEGKRLSTVGSELSRESIERKQKKSCDC